MPKKPDIVEPIDATFEDVVGAIAPRENTKAAPTEFAVLLAGRMSG